MAKPRSSKRDIDKTKRDRAALKRERRQGGGHGTADEELGAETPETPAAPAVPEGQVLAELEQLHARFDAGELDFEEFEVRRDDLLTRLAGG